LGVTFLKLWRTLVGKSVSYFAKIVGEQRHGLHMVDQRSISA
jgi:hypothetical protein